MSFNTYFRASSYAMIAVATLALVWAGALHWSLAVVFFRGHRAVLAHRGYQVATL